MSTRNGSASVTLRHAADRRHRRRLAVAAACAAALVIVPLSVTAARQNQSLAPVSPPGFDCLAPVHGPGPAQWTRDVLTEPGWHETFPPIPRHEQAEFTSVAANATGYLAIGRTYAASIKFGQPIPTWRDKAWFSTNGRTWTVSPQPTDFGPAVLATDGSFYALGSDADGTPSLWVTTNGRDWQSTTISHISQAADLPEYTGANLWGLRCIDGKIVAYGSDHSVISSADGQQWTRLDPHRPVPLYVWDQQPSLAGTGPAGTVAIAPWGDGWAGGRIWFHRP